MVGTFGSLQVCMICCHPQATDRPQRHLWQWRPCHLSNLTWVAKPSKIKVKQMKDLMSNCNLSNLWSFWGHFFKCWHLQNHETVTSSCSAQAADCQLHDATTFKRLLLWCVWGAWSVFQTDGGTRHVFHKISRSLQRKDMSKMLWIFLDPFPFEESIQLRFDWPVFGGNL